MSRKEDPARPGFFWENGFEFVKCKSKYNIETVPPPNQIPNDLYDEYTMGGKIPVVENYWDNTIKDYIFYDKVNPPFYASREDYVRAFEKFEKKEFCYYGFEIEALYEAFDKYSLADKTVLIWGLQFMNCEAISLWKNAKHVYVIDYNKPICEHEKITVLSHEELKSLNITTDIAISYSSFEHDGMGRYGDPLDPNGDLRAMSEAHKFLKDDGLLFLGIPVGGDLIHWNAGRVYGKLRLPLFLKGWHCIDVFNAQKAEATSPNYPFDAPFGAHIQFLMVCKKIETDYPEDSILRKEIEYSASYEATHSPDVCKRINSIILEYKKNTKS